MSSLYDIDRELLSCVDGETGEIIDPERLDALMMERNTKIENVACWVKNLQFDVIDFKAEQDALNKRQKAAEAKIDSLNKWLSGALSGAKFSTVKCAVSFKKSPPKVDIADERLIPTEYMTITTICKPDKIAIKEAIKAGQEISGCKLIQETNIYIN